jgi:gliding motility-associated GldM-like protein
MKRTLLLLLFSLSVSLVHYTAWGQTTEDTPKVKICGKNEGILKKSKLLSKPYLTISKTKLKWKIISFEATFATDKGTTNVCTVMGDKFSDKNLIALSSIRKGAKLYIENIRAANYKGETKNLNPITILIEYEHVLVTSKEAKIEAKKLDSLIEVVKQLKRDSSAFFEFNIKSTYYGHIKKGEVINQITPKLILEANLYPWSFNIERKKKLK